jgi:hypothetical protein
MTKQTQRDAVFTGITNVLAEHNITFEEGQDVGEIMTRELRSEVNAILFAGFKAGTIEISKEYNDTELKAYVSGLQSNWIRKDKRLNGGMQYVAKNPGSRAGSGDDQLKAMRALLKSLQVGSADHAEVQSCIDKRVGELNASKVKTTVDFSALPEALRNKFAK